MRISDWSSDVCSSDLEPPAHVDRRPSGNRLCESRGGSPGDRPGEALLRRAWLAADRCDTAIDRGNRGDHHELLRQARPCRGVMEAAASPAVANQLMAATAPQLAHASALTARAQPLARSAERLVWNA